MVLNRTSGYDLALQGIKTLTEELGLAVRQHLAAAVATLNKNPGSEDWRVRDDAIDEMRDRIVNRCFNIMCLQQLRTRDLRWITGYQRIAQELERVADYACDLAELAALNSGQDWPPEILAMANQLLSMITYDVDILTGDQEIGQDLDEQDDLLDKSYVVLQQELVRGKATENIQLGLAVVLARTLERMGDHAVNVAEMLLYIQTGKRQLAAKE